MGCKVGVINTICQRDSTKVELGNLPKVPEGNGIPAPPPTVQTHDFSITSDFSKSGSRTTCAVPEYSSWVTSVIDSC